MKKIKINGTIFFFLIIFIYMPKLSKKNRVSKKKSKKIIKIEIEIKH